MNVPDSPTGNTFQGSLWKKIIISLPKEIALRLFYVYIQYFFPQTWTELEGMARISNPAIPSCFFKEVSCSHPNKRGQIVKMAAASAQLKPCLFVCVLRIQCTLKSRWALDHMAVAAILALLKLSLCIWNFLSPFDCKFRSHFPPLCVQARASC